jgi:hypothetical protein
MDRTDLVPLTYAELGTILDQLTARVAAHCDATGTRYDLVAPILRSGAFTGMHLASRLGIVRTLPLQYKYGRGGEIVQTALADLRDIFPSSAIDFASAVMDQGCPRLDGVGATFFGTTSNEARLLSRDEADARSIRHDVFVFPWETAEEQWREIQG